MTTQTSVLKPYQPQPKPTLPDSADRYVPNELLRIASAFTQIIQVMKELDARLIAGGL
jgi:hypothetical protein